MVQSEKQMDSSDSLTISTNHKPLDDSLANHKPPDVSLTNQKTEKEVDDVEECDVVIETKDDLNKVPDGGWGWWIVVGACLVHVLMGGFERSTGILYLQLLDKFGQSATATSWVTSIFSTFRLFMGPLSSALVNRFSCRTVCALGAFLSTLGVILSGFAPNLPYLYFTYGVLAGLGRSMTYTPCLLIVGYYFNKKRGIAVGLATSGVGIGTFIFPAMVEVFFDTFGFLGTFLILGAIISNFFVCSALFRPLALHQLIMKSDRLRDMRAKNSSNCESGVTLLNGVPTPASMTEKQRSLLSDQAATKLASSMDITANLKIESRKSSLFKRKMSQVKLALKGPSSTTKERKPLLDISLFKNFAFTMLCIQLFLFTLAFNTTFVFLPAFVKENGLTQMEGALLVSIMGILDALARIIMSFILDLKKVKPYRLIIYNIVMILTGIVAVLIPSARTFWQFALVSAVFGILSGTYISQKSVVVVDVLGVESLASSFGLLLLFQGVSAFVGPTIGGIFKDSLGSYTMVFYFGSIGIFVGSLVMAAANVWLYKQKKPNNKGVS